MRSLLVSLFFIVAILGCGGSGSGGGAFKSLVIQPGNIAIKPGEEIQLTAVVDGAQSSVKWSIPAGSSGTITSGGAYRAPVASGTYPVKAELSSDASKFTIVNAVVDSKFIVKLSGAGNNLTVGTDGTLQLNSVVEGAASNAVIWSATSGTVNSVGLFTAPSTTGAVTITGMSVADPGKRSTLTLIIVPAIEFVSPSGRKFTVPDGKSSYKVRVSGQVSNNVTWSTNLGSIDTNGVLTAPSTPGGLVTVTATSKIDASKSVSVNVEVVSSLNVRYSFVGLGDILLELRWDKAPNHCRNLVSLVNQGFYDGIIAHRYEPGFVIQWGDPLTKTLPLSDPSIGTGGPGYSIDFEPNDLIHNRYVLAMARSSSLNSGGSQIYITLQPQPSLDGNYVVFGSVIDGTSVVDQLRRGAVISSAVVELPITL
jgi:cyclophilin family peptidyl-prolyl cis-trans isomerase